LPVATPEDLKGWVHDLADPRTPVEKKWAAAAAVTRVPPEQAYPALFFAMTDRPTWNGGVQPPPWGAEKFESLAKATGEWQSHLLIRRVWYDLRKVAKDNRGAVVAPLLPRATNNAQRDAVLNELFWSWPTGAEGAKTAEDAVVAIMRDEKAPLSLRTSAARAVLKNTRWKYHDEVRALAGRAQAPLEERVEWLDTLIDGPHGMLARQAGSDPVVLELAFGLMSETTQAAGKESAGYQIASRLEHYLGKEFKPNPRDPRYVSDHNLNEAFFADTVKNARAWWQTHGQGAGK